MQDDASEYVPAPSLYNNTYEMMQGYLLRNLNRAQCTNISPVPAVIKTANTSKQQACL